MRGKRRRSFYLVDSPERPGPGPPNPPEPPPQIEETMFPSRVYTVQWPLRCSCGELAVKRTIGKYFFGVYRDVSYTHLKGAGGCAGLVRLKEASELYNIDLSSR